MKRRQAPESIQYTVRNVPALVDRALRREASGTARSLNDVALDALARGVGVEGAPATLHDLDFLRGTWVEDPAVEGALAEQRKVDPALWR